MTESAPLRVGILGTGAVAQLIHIPNCARRTDVDLVALADADTPKAEALARRYGNPAVVAPEALIEGGDVDAIIICTPNHLHESEAVAALQAGKHVLVERPLALTPEGCRRVVEAAEAAGRSAMVGMNHRYRPDVAALRAFVGGGELGSIHAGRVEWLNRPAPMRRTTWRQRPEEAGGGALIDLGPQALDLLLWILGDVRVVSVRAVLVGVDDGVEEGASLLMTTETGAVLTMDVSWNSFASQDLHMARVLGSEGSGALPPLSIHRQVGGRPMDVTPSQEAPPRSASRYLAAHRRQLDTFFRSARGYAASPLPRGQEQVMAVLQGAYRSAREGVEVTL
jgi:predicted dehydrogenase